MYKAILPNLLKLLAVSSFITISYAFAQEYCSKCNNILKNDEAIRQLCCGHSYHASCLASSIGVSNKCPNCGHTAYIHTPEYNKKEHDKCTEVIPGRSSGKDSRSSSQRYYRRYVPYTVDRYGSSISQMGQMSQVCQIGQMGQVSQVCQIGQMGQVSQMSQMPGFSGCSGTFVQLHQNGDKLYLNTGPGEDNSIQIDLSEERQGITLFHNNESNVVTEVNTASENGCVQINMCTRCSYTKK